jgi:hypothetical protein
MTLTPVRQVFFYLKRLSKFFDSVWFKFLGYQQKKFSPFSNLGVHSINLVRMASEVTQFKEQASNNCTLEGLNPATAGAGCKWQKYLIDLESGRSAVGRTIK